MSTLINDPRGPGEIDVTGWELDRLAETLMTLRSDMRDGADRPLSGDEEDALVGETPWGLLPGPTVGGWWTSDALVEIATDRLSEVVEEARYQRDLPRALDAKAQGRTLTLPEQEAYDRYVADIGRD